jgi:voltage-gated potassium channel
MSISTSYKPNGLIRSGADRKKILLRTNVVLLLAISMLIFIVPVIPLKEHHLTRVLMVIVVASGLFAAEFSRAAFRILLTIGTMVILVTLSNLFLPDARNLSLITFTLNTLYFIVITLALVAHVASAKDVYGSTLLCAINSYLLIGLTLSILFLLLDLFVPGSFEQVKSGRENFSTFVYYGFITLTTLGYGDITPSTTLARSLSAFTALIGQLYLVIIMAIIIGKFLIVHKSEK